MISILQDTSSTLQLKDVKKLLMKESKGNQHPLQETSLNRLLMNVDNLVIANETVDSVVKKLLN